MSRQCKAGLIIPPGAQANSYPITLLYPVVVIIPGITGTSLSQFYTNQLVLCMPLRTAILFLLSVSIFIQGDILGL